MRFRECLPWVWCGYVGVALAILAMWVMPGSDQYYRNLVMLLVINLGLAPSMYGILTGKLSRFGGVVWGLLGPLVVWFVLVAVIFVARSSLS